MHPSTLAKRGTVLLFITVLAFYLYGIGHLPFVGPDEPRYAQVAREMFLRGDLVTPTLGGRTWFEKPALLYWLMIASFKLFGVSEWAARLPSAISGVLTIVAVFVVGRCIEDRKDSLNSKGCAFWSTIAAATMIGIVVFSQAASFDILLTMTTTWALAFYALHSLEEYSGRNDKPRGWLLAGFYIFVGLSLLAKGLVGIVIPVGVIGLYHIFQRRLPGRRTLFSIVWGVPLALFVAGVWYGPVIQRHGWLFIDQFFIQHHFARYVSNKYHHSQPVYYYLIVLPLLVLPWTAFLIHGLVQFKSWLWRDKPEGHDLSNQRLNQLMAFALAWFLFPLIFFSFSGSKLPGYILPILPAAGLIVGRQLWQLTSAAGWPLRTTATIYLLFAIGAPVYSWRTGDLPLTAALSVAVPLLAGGCLPFFIRKPDTSIALMAVMTAAALIVVMYSVAPRFADRESSRSLLQFADAQGYSQSAIYGMQRSDRTPEFYAAGRVVYGADGEPILYEGPGQLIQECRRRNEVLLAFVAKEEVNQLAEVSSVKTDVIGNNGRYAIVAVGPR